MINPIIRRDGKIFLRNFKSFLILSVYSVLLLLTAFIANFAISSNSYSFVPESASYIFWAIGAFQIGMLMLIIPAYAGTAITGEREKQTLDILLSTKMSSFSIVFGKLISSISMGTLLLVASLPVTSVIFYYGGVSIIDFIVLTVYTFLMMVLSASVAILFSSFMKKSSAAIALTNVVMIFHTIGNLLGVLIINSLVIAISGDSTSIPPVISFLALSINPILGYFGIAQAQLGIDVVENVVSSFSNNYRGGYDIGLMSKLSAAIMSIPIWIYTSVFTVFIIAICLLLAVRNLRRMSH